MTAATPADGDEVGAGGEAVDDVQHPGRQSGVDERRGESIAHQRGHGGGLEHDGVAGGERRPDLAARHVEREVPRCDDGDHADRVEHGVHERRVVARERRSAEPVRLAGVELEVLRRPRRLVACVGQWLALLGDHLGGDRLGTGCEQVGGPAEHLGALRWRAPPPTAEALRRGGDGGRDIVGRRFGGGRHHVATVGRIAPFEDGSVGRAGALAADQVEHLDGRAHCGGAQLSHLAKSGCLPSRRGRP